MLIRYRIAMWVFLFTIPAIDALAQLPDLPDAPFSVRAEVFAIGLPFEAAQRSPTWTQRIGPTNQIPFPSLAGHTAVTNLGGKVVILDGNGTAVDNLLDLGTTGSSNENPDFEWGVAHGITAFAFHPGYASPRSAGYKKFYIVETEELGAGIPDFSKSVSYQNNAPGNFNGPHDEVLYEYTSSVVGETKCDTACVATKREVLRVAQPGWHHNIGDLAFDTNELLYISSGDGSTAGTTPPIISDNSKTLENVFGKVLRIDPLSTGTSSYTVPTTNPFVDGTGPNVDEIYAYGLRNPYRLDFDPMTGDLYASETGESSIESVNLIQAGGNHGWNLKEASYIYDPTTRNITPDTDGNANGIGDLAETHNLIDPIFEYDRDDGNAIIGGILYRGSGVPDLYGKYVFADTSGKLFYGDPATRQAYEMQFDMTGFPLPVNSRGNPLPFEIHGVATDAEGEITVLGMVRHHDGTFDAASIRITAVPEPAITHVASLAFVAFGVLLVSRARRTARTT